MTNQRITQQPATRIWLRVATAILSLLLLGGGVLMGQPAMAAPQSAATVQQEWPILHQVPYDTGVTCRTLQYLLNAHGANIAVDGVFGPKTTSAVRTFQRSHGLVVDGVVGNQTWPALLITVRHGSTGSAVRAVQDQLNARVTPYGYHELQVAVDGRFGPLTDAAVHQFQSEVPPPYYGPLAVDGIVGPQTWYALVLGALRVG